MGAIRFKYEPTEPVLESEIPDLTAAINDQVKIMRQWERQFDFAMGLIRTLFCLQ